MKMVDYPITPLTVHQKGTILGNSNTNSLVFLRDPSIMLKSYGMVVGWYGTKGLGPGIENNEDSPIISFTVISFTVSSILLAVRQ